MPALPCDARRIGPPAMVYACCRRKNGARGIARCNQTVI